MSTFAIKNKLLFVVDAISAFLSEPLDMSTLSIDVVISSSQKALSCQPGISFVVLSERALKRVSNNSVRSLYFDYKNALSDADRGQTPFTPAVNIILQIHERLKNIESRGGVFSEINRIKTLAQDFRSKIADFPFDITSQSLPNAVTPLHPHSGSAYQLFLVLQKEYDIWVCPNGGTLKESIFRVGHIGSLTTSDNDCLIDALLDLMKKGYI